MMNVFCQAKPADCGKRKIWGRGGGDYSIKQTNLGGSQTLALSLGPPRFAELSHDVTWQRG